MLSHTKQYITSCQDQSLLGVPKGASDYIAWLLITPSPDSLKMGMLLKQDYFKAVFSVSRSGWANAVKAVVNNTSKPQAEVYPQ